MLEELTISKLSVIVQLNVNKEALDGVLGDGVALKLTSDLICAPANGQKIDLQTNGMVKVGTQLN